MRLLLLSFFLIPVSLLAQDFTAPRFVKTAVGETGCFAYLPQDMPEFEMNPSEDGAEVYTAEVTVGDFAYSCIGVKFSEPFSDSSPDDMEALLESYLDFLKDAFEIEGSAGYGHGHTLEAYPDARGLLDYWRDADGLEYSIMGWANQSNLGVLIIYGKTEYPSVSAANMYLNGWRFGK
ncbi:MAG: hypothetical protein IPL65_21095 [Lewinellaceae bacterium]|nr:hypothetical protein [Lewinellaceae bacterium]